LRAQGTNSGLRVPSSDFRFLLQLLFDLVNLGLDGLDLGHGVLGILQQRGGDFVGVDLLVHVAEATVVRKLHLTAVGLHFAHEQVEDRALAGAVGPHDADAVARMDREAHVLQHRLGAEVLGDSVERNHAR
jgi:hypothetical protein